MLNVVYAMKVKSPVDQEGYFIFLTKDTFIAIIAVSLGKKWSGYS